MSEATAASNVQNLVAARDKIRAELGDVLVRREALERQLAEVNNALGGVQLGEKLAAEKAAEEKTDAPEG